MASHKQCVKVCDNRPNIVGRDEKEIGGGKILNGGKSSWAQMGVAYVDGYGQMSVVII